MVLHTLVANGALNRLVKEPAEGGRQARVHSPESPQAKGTPPTVLFPSSCFMIVNVDLLLCEQQP